MTSTTTTPSSTLVEYAEFFYHQGYTGLEASAEALFALYQDAAPGKDDSIRSL